ncbi:MAG TPA: AAA family ATPase [Bacteroidales bacterium]|nr:AAA family ATPase [Bacteroidales bacterium]
MGDMFFGIEAIQIPDFIEDKNDFARCLFFTQALTSSDVYFLMQVIAKLSQPEVLAIYDTLKKEISEEANLKKEILWLLEVDVCKKIYDKNKSHISPIEKLTTWENYFKKLSNVEKSDYFNIFRIYFSESDEVLKKQHLTTFRKPKDIYKELCKFVKGQDEAKKHMSFAFYLHLIRTRRIIPEIYNITNVSRRSGDVLLPDPHIMLLGPTGSGKTHIIKTLCEMYDVPFVKVDCAQMVSSGYIGSNIEDALTLLYLKARTKFDAENGVVFFDEFDKISEQNTNKGNVGGVALQQEFLSLIEGADRVIKQDLGRYAEGMAFKTKNLMFIFSGSFAGIERIIEKRMNATVIGFRSAMAGHETSADNILKSVSPQDFIDFGIIPELVGRINYYLALDILTKQQIIEIIKNTQDSFLNAYENFFWIHYDKLIVDDDVCEMIADRVIELKLGARAIRGILQKLLSEALFQSPNIIMETFHITKDDFIKTFNK